MNAGAQPQTPRGAPGRRLHGQLDLDDRAHGIFGMVECGQYAVAGMFERVAACLADRAMHDLIMQIHRRHHVRWKTSVQFGTADDIRRQKG
ncbi:MAG: hypothetical protein QF512_17660 [Alphaproteobacteria bacterium]|jgi:hypothetical protein|nr:hypothetical protein [Alphaproteobacteria bacterium]